MPGGPKLEMAILEEGIFMLHVPVSTSPIVFIRILKKVEINGDKTGMESQGLHK